ncbi:hypothetical protein F1880_002866 [Penicillium rolfsii]|nr:hypothetical protein F1880_002866 [Penicillium rolfsii]
MPNVLKRFKMVNDGISSELNRAAKAYKDQKGINVDLVDCWDRFFKQTKDSMVSVGRNFVVNTAIAGMRARWAHNSEASGEWNARAEEVRNALRELESHVGEIHMDDLKLERLT